MWSQMMVQVQVQVLLLILVLVLFSFSPHTAALPVASLEEVWRDVENYNTNTDVEWENLDPNVFGVDYDYDDLDSEEEKEMKLGVAAPTTPPSVAPSTAANLGSAPVTLDFKGSGLFGPETGLGMPTCILCVCLRGSVYCDDMALDQIPPLPKDTSYFYARFNRIRHVKNTDFLNLEKLRSVDLTGNQISEMDRDVFSSQTQLQQLLLADNDLQTLPWLPDGVKNVDLRNNRLISQGLQPEVFKDMQRLEFLYLSGNNLDYIPTPLPLSLRVLHLQDNNIQSVQEDTFCDHGNRHFLRRNLEDVRLDGNPLNVDLFVQMFVCLPRLPVGSHWKQ